MAILSYYGLDFCRVPGSGKLYVFRSVRTDEPVNGRLEMLRYDDAEPPVQVGAPVTIEASGVTSASFVGALACDAYADGRLWVFYCRAGNVRYRESTDRGATWSAEETPVSAAWPTPGVVDIMAAGFDPPAGRFIVIAKNFGPSSAALVVLRRDPDTATWITGAAPRALETDIHFSAPLGLERLRDGSFNYMVGGSVLRLTRVLDDGTYERGPIVTTNPVITAVVDPRTGVLGGVQAFLVENFRSGGLLPFYRVWFLFKGGTLLDNGGWQVTSLQPTFISGPGLIAYGGGNWPHSGHIACRVRVRRDGVFEFCYVPFAGIDGTAGEVGFTRSTLCLSNGEHRFPHPGPAVPF